MISKSRLLAVAASGVALGLALTGCTGGSSSDDGTVELSFLVDNTEANIATVEALVEAFMADNPDITIDVETRPGGEEGDNLIKTRLATGEMTDLFWYNSGSLMQALNPDQTLMNLEGEDFMAPVSETFVAGVSTEAGVYGVPIGPGMGGGILYNTAIYEELGLEVPTTWDDFMDNNQAISDAGYDAVIQTYADAWTAQLFVLSDFYNVLAENPEWADQYTANEVNFADDPVAIRGFERLEEVNAAGFLNKDYASSTLDDGLRMLATGEGAHYPMLTFAVSTILEVYPENADDIGFFAQHGDGPSHGLTTWLANAVYAPANTEHPEAVQRFMAFVATEAACTVQTDAVGVTGPYFIDGCTLPDDVPNATADMLPYFETEGGTAAALEFLSPVKGPSLPQITVEVGSGIRSAADGAALYDQDVTKQAQQLGLEGW